MGARKVKLPRVAGTQVRGKFYHLNLRIKPEIQYLFDGKTHLRGSLHTSDPKEARREVERRRAELLEKEQEHARQLEVDDLVAQLSPEQRAAYDEAGGLEGLLETFTHLRGGTGTASDAPSEAGRKAVPTDPARAPIGDSAGESSGDSPETGPEPVPEPEDPEDPEDRGQDHAPRPAPTADDPTPDATETETEIEIEPVGEGWPDTGHALAIVGTTAGDGEIEDALFTLADLLEEYALQLDPDTTDTMRHIVRLFTEFSGEIAFDELTMAHLDAFAKAAHGLPAEMMARLDDGTLVRDLPYTEMVAWTTASPAAPMSETTRFHYVSALKQLMAFGVPRYRRGDPWTDYRIQVIRREPVEEPPRRAPNRFSPSEWTFTAALGRAFEITILVLIAALLYLLWEARF